MYCRNRSQNQRETLASLGSHQADPPLICKPPAHQEFGTLSHQLLKEASRPNLVLLEALELPLHPRQQRQIDVPEQRGQG